MSRVFGDQFAPIPEWILFHPDLSDRAVRLFGVLQRFSREAGGRIPGRALLAARLRCSKKSLDRAKAELVAVGAVEVVYRFKAGSKTPNDQRTNDYRLCTDTQGRATSVSTGRDSRDARVGTRVSPVVKATSERPKLRPVEDITANDPLPEAPPWRRRA